MASRGVTRRDVDLALTRGVLDSFDHENGTWRYRLRIPAVTVVVALRSEDALVVVTVLT
jgi:hypothetical protein